MGGIWGKRGAGAAPTTGTGSSVGAMWGNPWADTIDAAQAAPGRFEGEAAMEGISALEGAAELTRVLADVFTKVGANVLDRIYIDPRVASAYEEMGSYIGAAADKLDDAAKSVRAAHADDIDRIEENDQRKRAWDIQAHDGIR